MTRAVISLGTNTTRLLIVRDQAGGSIEQVERGSIGTRLGEGLEHGALGSEPMQRTLDAIAAFMERVRAVQAQVSCIATSAMRRGSNAADFAERVRAETGLAPRILSGSDEAAASFAGATFGATSGDARVAVIDIGGGSTECAVGRPGHLEAAKSLEIGAVRLSERFPQLTSASGVEAARAASAPARAAVARIVAELGEFAPVGEARAVGGTPLTLGAIAFGSDVEAVSERPLDRSAIDELIKRMLSLDLAGRRALPGMVAQRADILPAGALILSEVLRTLERDAVLLEANDLLLGYLIGAVPEA